MIVLVNREVTISNPTPDIKTWCKKNLTLPNPEYTQKQRMGFWTGNTPRTISLYGEDGKDLKLPFGAIDMLPEELLKDSIVFEGFHKSVPACFGGTDVELYDYQEDAVNAVFGIGHGILQAPAGCGKTQMGIALAKKFGGRTLWLTHTHDLLEQSKERAMRYIDEDAIGVITGGKVKVGTAITFATVQTMSNLDLLSYRTMFDTVIVDECHRVAGSPTAVTQFYKVLAELDAPHKVGLSATVHRADGMIKATYALLGGIAYSVPEDAVGDKILKVGIKPVNTGVKVDLTCVGTDGMLNYGKLITSLSNNQERSLLIESALEDNKDKSCLILSDRIEHLKNIMNLLPNELKENAVIVTGSSKPAVREKAIEQMRSGDKKYLFASYRLAKEGLDIPRLERLFLVTPQKDYAVITQSIGRIARAFDGKADPIVYDFVDDIEYCARTYKKRCTTYRKNGCYFLEE